jgi:hypothetical protein
MIYAGPTVPFPLSTAYPVIALGKTTGGAHDTVSLAQFDLSGVTATAAEVTSATLRVFSTTSTVVNATNLDPDGGHAIEIAVSAITGTWNRANVTWSNFGVGSPHTVVVNTFEVDALGQFFTVDVTDIVKDWLDGSLTNNGLWLEATTVMGSGPSGTESPYYAVAFNSGFLPLPPFGPGGPNTNGPVLTINAVPEPATVALAVVALPALTWALMRSKRRKAMHG